VNRCNGRTCYSDGDWHDTRHRVPPSSDPTWTHVDAHHSNSRIVEICIPLFRRQPLGNDRRATITITYLFVYASGKRQILIGSSSRPVSRRGQAADTTEEPFPRVGGFMRAIMCRWIAGCDAEFNKSRHAQQTEKQEFRTSSRSFSSYRCPLDVCNEYMFHNSGGEVSCPTTSKILSTNRQYAHGTESCLWGYEVAGNQGTDPRREPCMLWVS
jgi:hypothetical protein